MKNIKFIVCLLVGEYYSQNEIPKKSFVHTFSYDVGATRGLRILPSSFNYIIEKTTKTGAIQPYLGLEFFSSKVPPFVRFNRGNYYGFLGIKLGGNVKMNNNWKFRFNIEAPILKWFDSNVLGDDNNILPNIGSIYNIIYTTQVKRLIPIETTFSRKIYRGFSGYSGLRYFIVQTSPKIPFYKIRQTLYLQMGVSYTF